MVLVLSSQQLSAISAHAERVYPEECCGLMVGEMRPQSEQAQSEQTQSNTSRQQQPVKQLIKQPVKQVVQLFPLINNWTPDEGTPDVETTEARTEAPTETSTEKSLTRTRRYWIDPKDMLRVQKQARSQGLNIIGVYHSHPDQVAEPSECDRAGAWAAYAYAIVSVCEGKAVDVRNWTLDSEHQFQLEPIKISPSAAKDRMPVSA